VAAGKEHCDADTASGKTTDDKYCHRTWPQRLEQLINRLLIIESFDASVKNDSLRYAHIIPSNT
jgi:hypothetical protein